MAQKHISGLQKESQRITDIESNFNELYQRGSGNVDDVKVNGVSVVDTDKIAQVTVPTNTSVLTNNGEDGAHPFVDSTLVMNSPATTVSNPLANKDFVNSSIATETAYFRGTFDATAELLLIKPASHASVQTALLTAVSVVTNNDYCFVVNLDSLGAVLFERYKYTSATSTWGFEFALNNSSFTQAQWSAINSGITISIVANILYKNGDSKDNKVTFTEDSGTSNISSGESHALIFGKIKKWFSRLKALAFKDTVTSTDVDGTIAKTSDLSSYLAKGGGIMTGAITCTSQGSIWNALNIKDTKGSTIGFNTSGQIGFMAKTDSGSVDNAFTFRVNSNNRFRIGNTNIRPETTDSYNLGTSANRWNNVYGKTAYHDTIYQNNKQVANVEDIPTSVNGMSGGSISSAVDVSGNITGRYLIGTWLQTTATTENASYTDFFVNNGGWLYKRSKANVKSDLGITPITASTTDIGEGSELATGTLYVVYED